MSADGADIPGSLFWRDFRSKPNTLEQRGFLAPARGSSVLHALLGHQGHQEPGITAVEICGVDRAVGVPLTPQVAPGSQEPASGVVAIDD